VLHSLNIVPSGLPRYIEVLKPDVINLHWLGGEMISVGEIARLKPPIVWTLHDMWAFSGAEHYDDDKPSERYREGYSQESRHQQHGGVDLDRWNFLRKQKAWAGKRFHIVTPSRWLGECVRQSSLFSGQPLHVIPNCVDHQVYHPLNKSFAREALSLPKDKLLVLFGAMSSTSDPRKGYQLLIPALKQLKAEGKAEQLELVVFGAAQGDAEQVTGISTHYMGRLHDDISLCLLYNAADVFVAPSLQDNLPNTLVESMACGTPCIAFDIGGMRDLINSKNNGCLISDVNFNSLADGILKFSEIKQGFSAEKIAEESALTRSLEAVSSIYSGLYQNAK
jgi:glycosyltransferase involved in cell wall biosynthesis